jgi:protein-S-isoprenylcysteine O-methyltransferase Ste14
MREPGQEKEDSTMVYVIFVLVEIPILVWFVGAVRKSEWHEIAMSVGAFLYVFLCFENFGKLLLFDYWKLADVPWLTIPGNILLVSGGVLFLTTFFTMRRLGKPSDAWENTTQLIETGVFGVIRHPIYFSAFLVMVGLLLMWFSTISLIVTFVACICFFLAAWFEDRWNEEKFGETYRHYQEHTRLFFPFIF